MVDLNDFEIKQMITTLVKKKVPVDPTLDIYEAMLKDERKRSISLVQGSKADQNDVR